MPYRHVDLFGFRGALLADRQGLALSLSYQGKWWQRLVARLRPTYGDEAAFRAPADPGQAVALGGPDGGKPLTDDTCDQVFWYHTLDFGDGHRTSGQYDHQAILERYRLPEDLSGKSVLDVATFDGFWAFEFEKRGAARVVALDLDRPAECDLPPAWLARATAEEREVRFGAGFEYAKRRLGSRVERVSCSVYDLTPERFGLFDVVHAGDFLLHLNSPVKALQRMAAVCREYALISEVYYPDLDLAGDRRLVRYLGGHHDVTWWNFSLSALEQMVRDAGFSRVERLATFRYGPRSAPQALHHVVFKAYR